MSDETSAGASAPIFHEIKAASTPQQVYRFRSITGLSYVTAGLVGLNAAALLLQFLGLCFRQSALDTMSQIAASGALLGLVTLLPAYIVAAFWIYNAACNTRALGARGMQISPGWAVGWFAVPLASLFMPFQGIEETYLASASPVGWRSLKTPLLLRVWWGAWLGAGLGGYVAAIFAPRFASASEFATATVLNLVAVALSLTACLCFMTIVWRTFRAQVYSRTNVQAHAEVFS